MQLRIAQTVPDTEAEGPGKRFALWVQGCTLGCAGCFNPATHDPRGGELWAVADLAARLAGDEFAALLTGLDDVGVAGWYQRLAERFRYELDTFGLDLHTSLSAGQTWLCVGTEDSLNQALVRADRALYEAKARGRGQLVQEDAPATE